jgi:hypothetical protein
MQQLEVCEALYSYSYEELHDCPLLIFRKHPSLSLLLRGQLLASRPLPLQYYMHTNPYRLSSFTALLLVPSILQSLAPGT